MNRQQVAIGLSIFVIAAIILYVTLRKPKVIPEYHNPLLDIIDPDPKKPKYDIYKDQILVTATDDYLGETDEDICLRTCYDDDNCDFIVSRPGSTCQMYKLSSISGDTLLRSNNKISGKGFNDFPAVSNKFYTMSEEQCRSFAGSFGPDIISEYSQETGICRVPKNKGINGSFTAFKVRDHYSEQEH